jgi:hypothetical protein
VANKMNLASFFPPTFLLMLFQSHFLAIYHQQKKGWCAYLISIIHQPKPVNSILIDLLHSYLGAYDFFLR